MNNLYCRTYNTGRGLVLACCDKELLGKRLVEGNYDVTVDESFYKGEKISEKRLAELLGESSNINLFGKKAVRVALKQGFLTETGIIRIAGVEHAIIFKM